MEGKITAQSQAQLTVNTQENIVFHVRYDDRTKIERKDGASASRKDLKVGEKIEVDGQLAESGEIYATKIVIE